MDGYIQVCDVEKYYGNGSHVTKAVDRVSFRVEKGEFVGVMGASGSGKTTLLNLLATIDRVSAGHIYYQSGGVHDGRWKETNGGRWKEINDGRCRAGSENGAGKTTAGACPEGYVDITELSENALSDFRKKNLGFVFQDYNLLDTLTIEENILLALTLQGGEKREMQNTCDEMLKLLEITDVRDKFPYQVSGGQAQRCACARAMVNHPQLLLADEPTGALDSHSAQTLLETFSNLNRTLGATILMVTHDAFSASYCSRILFLKDGKIFHELVRGNKSRNTFLQEILDVLSLTGGERNDAL